MQERQISMTSMKSSFTLFTNALEEVACQFFNQFSSFWDQVGRGFSLIMQNLWGLQMTAVDQLIQFPQDLALNQQTIITRKFVPSFDETTNAEFEELVNLGKFQEAIDYLYYNDSAKIQEVKTHTLNNFIDRLLDCSQTYLCFQLFKILTVYRPSIVTKFAVKRLFKLAVRVGQKEQCLELISHLQESEKVSEQIELLFRMNQYLISSSFKHGDYQLAHSVFTSLKQSQPFTANVNSSFYFKIYEIMIKGCLSKQVYKLDDSKSFLNEIASHQPNDVFFNKLIDFAAKNNEISFAEYIFKVMVSNNIQPSIVTYNTLIDSYFKQNRYNQAWILFELLKKSDKKPDNFTYTTMINGLKSMERPDLTKAFTLFAEYKQINKPDQIIYNCLLDACINSGDLNRAHELLCEMKQDSSVKLDEITYNTLIKGCCKSRRLNQAIEYYEEMKSLHIRPNRITHNSLIDTCVKSGKMREAWRFYEEMIALGITADNFTYSILINGIKSNHSNKDELSKALELLNGIQANPNFKPDEILYNSLIDACIKFNEITKGLSLYEEMKKKRIEPSSVTYGILIKAFGKMNDLVKAFQIFEQMKLKQMKINDVTYGCLLDACVKNDRMDLALILIDKMKQDNIVLNTILYTTLIKGFSKAGKLEEALRIFNTMKESPKAQPNQITYNCTIDACVKADNLAKASELFEELNSNDKGMRPDLITYSTLIKGFCRQKNIDKAYYYLTHMQKQNIKPDEALFNQVLECCHSCNSCDLGIEIFNMMTSPAFRVAPSNITFSILIKLYSKSRKLNKAVNVIEQMRTHKVRPSLITYTNLIQACFKANKADKVNEVLQEMEKDNLKCDSIFYAKLTAGFISSGMIEAAWKYAEKAIKENVILGLESYKQISRALSESNCQDKAQRIARIEDCITKLNVKKPFEPEPQGHYNNENNRNRSNQTTTSEYEEGYQKKHFTNSNYRRGPNVQRGNKENFENRNSNAQGHKQFYGSKKKYEEVPQQTEMNFGAEKSQPMVIGSKNASFFEDGSKSVLKENNNQMNTKKVFGDQTSSKKALTLNNREFFSKNDDPNFLANTTTRNAVPHKSIYSSKFL